jgi:serine/threonine-protein kinase
MELPSEQRHAFIHSQCSDETILAQVFALISSDDDEFTLSNNVERESDLFHHQSLVSVGDIVSVYQLESCLGHGGMGTVFKAIRIDGSFEQTVAIKVISPHLYKLLDTNRLNSEANFMAKLNHNNICKVHDAGITDSGIYFIVMEHIEGVEIATFFAESRVTLNDKLIAFGDLCEAVNYAHQQQIVHGDLKPANILFTNNKQIKILDFGISHVITEQNTSLSSDQKIHFYAMTTDYASPELMNGEKPSVYSDVYALGKVLSCLLSLCKVELYNNGAELLAITNKATATLTTERYASVSELKNDINLFLSGHVVSTYQADHFYRLKKFVFNRHPISATTSLIFVIIFSILIANLIYQHLDLKSEKYQTDLMLEKFSLVLDLDLDAKSDVEISLANNYESRDEDKKASKLYQKVISRVDMLNNTDAAFDAGARLLNLFIKRAELTLIESTLDMLKGKLQFFPGSNLPVTASQAMFYHFFINSTYHRSESINSKIFKFHTRLMKDIKDKYWQELTSQQKAELFYSMDVKDNSQTLSTITSSRNHPEFQKTTEKTSIYEFVVESVVKFKSKVVGLIYNKNSQSEKYIPSTQQVTHFLESSPVYWASTHERRFNYEKMNSATFFEGVSKFKAISGVYNVHNNILTMDFGEGAESDSYLYISAKLALSVPFIDGDLTVLAHDDFLSGKNNQNWSNNELINNDWYHIYDNASDPNEAVQPSLVKIKFDHSSANLMKGKVKIDANWSIDHDLLILKSSEGNSVASQLVKVASDGEIIIIKDKGSMLLSVFIKNKEQAEFIIKSWQSLL